MFGFASNESEDIGRILHANTDNALHRLTDAITPRYPDHPWIRPDGKSSLEMKWKVIEITARDAVQHEDLANERFEGDTEKNIDS